MTAGSLNPGSTLRVELLRTWDHVRVLRGDWDALLRAREIPCTPLTWDWLEAWWATYGDAYAPFVLACRDADGTLRGVAPLMIVAAATAGLRARTLRFAGDAGVDAASYDLLAERGWEAAVCAAVVERLASETDAWDMVELRHVPAESQTLAAFRDQAALQRWVLEERRAAHLVVDLPATWDALLQGLSKKARWAATYSDRNLSRAGALLHRRCERAEELPSFLDALFGLHSARWSLRGQTGNFHDPMRRTFYADLAARLLANGALDLDVLELDGRPVAAHLGVRLGGTYTLIDGGFDPGVARYSPGVVLTSRVLRRLIAAGGECYDFLEGAEAYKLRWFPRELEYVYLRVARPRTVAAGVLRLAGVRAKLRPRP